MQCRVTSAVKVHGARYPAGAVVDLTDTEYAQLLEAGIITTAPPLPPPLRVKIPRTEQEKQAALDEAKKRVGRAGVPVIEPEP